ncbi:hypothetical protein TNCV_1372111 [Trichonephila clavipes]|nr:hypothetical protein TNCV_1372111 [Trichonephila clavipes]
MIPTVAESSAKICFLRPGVVLSMNELNLDQAPQDINKEVFQLQRIRLQAFVAAADPGCKKNSLERRQIFGQPQAAKAHATPFCVHTLILPLAFRSQNRDSSLHTSRFQSSTLQSLCSVAQARRAARLQALTNGTLVG